MKKNDNGIFIGTSGWTYDWKTFYPEKMPGQKKLVFYFTRFDAVEANFPFYRLPEKATYRNWRRNAPEGRIFALKLSRYITHVKRLKIKPKYVRKYFVHARELGKNLGPVLVQLPPSLPADPDRLKNFLAITGEVMKKAKVKPGLAFEFRHRSWFDDTPERKEILKILKKQKAALVFAHSSKYFYPDDEPVTGKFVYLRFHGPKELFGSKYGPKGLKSWAAKIRKWRKQGLPVYAFFNNDMKDYAPSDAATLKDLLGIH